MSSSLTSSQTAVVVGISTSLVHTNRSCLPVVCFLKIALSRSVPSFHFLQPLLFTPLQHRTAIKVPRSDILDSPSSKPTLKPEVRRKLDEIASLTYAHIAVVNSPLSLSSRTPPDGVSTSAGWTGLETERVCELVVTGQGDATELARVRLLVMLDELVCHSLCSSRSRSHSIYQSGLHAEACEIDQKLHAIIAGRKRHVLQSIQEETATNIYYPSPLQGLVGPDLVTPSVGTNGNSPSGQAQGSQHQQAHNPNVIWITGEFFGVQRARDMLFQLSVNKVCSVPCVCESSSPGRAE